MVLTPFLPPPPPPRTLHPYLPRCCTSIRKSSCSLDFGTEGGVQPSGISTVDAITTLRLARPACIGARGGGGAHRFRSLPPVAVSLPPSPHDCRLMMAFLRAAG